MSVEEKNDKPGKIPAHVAIIMDGNGRWALQRGLPRIEGHRAGTENLRRALEGCHEIGIRYLTLYAFSTENWGRPAEEVQGLMSILEEMIDTEIQELHDEGVKLQHFGSLERLHPELRAKVQSAVEKTRDNDRLYLNIAFNYGNNGSFGAVGHWSTPDMGWWGAHSPAPAANTWWQLVYTYDGSAARVYVNGEQESVVVVQLNTHAVRPELLRRHDDDPTVPRPKVVQGFTRLEVRELQHLPDHGQR